MKKHLIFLFITFITTVGFSQHKTETAITVTKSKLAEVKVIGDLVKDMPKDFKSFAVEITAKNHGKLMKATSNTETLTVDEIELLKNADVNSKFYIDIKYTDPKDNKVKIITTGFKAIE